MRHLPGLLSMPEPHKNAQVKAYLKFSGDVKHPLNEKLGKEVHSHRKRGTGWMNEASRTISKCCDVQQVSNGETWQSIDDDRFTQVIAILGCEYCELTKGAVNLAINSLIKKIACLTT